MVWVRQQRERHPHGRRWDELRAEVLTRYPICYLRLDRCTLYATEVDAVLPMHRGGSHSDPANLRGVCHSCHVVKTAREAAQAKPKTRRNPEPPPGAK